MSLNNNQFRYFLLVFRGSCIDMYLFPLKHVFLNFYMVYIWCVCVYIGIANCNWTKPHVPINTVFGEEEAMFCVEPWLSLCLFPSLFGCLCSTNVSICQHLCKHSPMQAYAPYYTLFRSYPVSFSDYIVHTFQVKHCQVIKVR